MVNKPFAATALSWSTRAQWRVAHHTSQKVMVPITGRAIRLGEVTKDAE